MKKIAIIGVILALCLCFTACDNEKGSDLSNDISNGMSDLSDDISDGASDLSDDISDSLSDLNPDKDSSESQPASTKPAEINMEVLSKLDGAKKRLGTGRKCRRFQQTSRLSPISRSIWKI